MSRSERNSGERKKEGQDSLDKTRQIVNLVLKLPYHPTNSDTVLNAVGRVLDDLDVFEGHQNLMRQLGSGITTKDVHDAKRQVLEAVALRPIDEKATEERIIVLAGLQRIGEATEFNERVARLAQNGDSSIAIFQAGISPRFVQQAIEHVNAAKQLVEEASRPVQPNKEAEVLPSSDNPVEQNPQTEKAPPKIDDIPVFTPPGDFVNKTVTKSPEPHKYPKVAYQSQPTPRKSGGISRRGILIRTGFGLGGLVTAGQLTGIVPVLSWTANFLDWHPKTLEQEDEFIKNKSLSDKWPDFFSQDWSVMYPLLQDDEVFVSLFNNYKQQVDNLGAVPIYAPAGGDNPAPVFVANTAFGLEVYESRVSSPLVAVKDWDSHWYLVSGRKVPESPEQRSFPNVIQVESSVTGSISYLEVTPTKVRNKNLVEIRYMKRVKKTSLDQNALNTLR